MKAMFKLFPLAVLLTVGCATQPTMQNQGGGVDASVNKGGAEGSEKAVANAANLPNIPLTGELLNDLILADVAAQRGHFNVSVGLYLQLANYTQDPRLAERATRMANYADMQKEALEAANLWVGVDPENIAARQLLTALLVKGGESGSAVDHLERIIDSETAPGDGFMAVASLLSRERDKDVALSLMNQLVAKRDNEPNAYLALSHLALRLGEHGEALAALERALELKPGWQAATVQRARVLVGQGEASQAADYLMGLIKKQPDVSAYRLFYARLLMEQERLPEAYEQFKAASKLQPSNEDALFALGFIGLQLNHLDDAEVYLLKLKKIGNRGYEVNYYLGRLEELRDNPQAARQWYGSIAQGEHFMNAQIRIVVLTAQDGDLAGARALVQKLKSQRPAQKLRMDLVEGEVLVGEGEYEEAMKVYNKALLDAPENTDLLYARSMVADKLGDLETLEHDLRKILARDPNNAEALNALGYSLADTTTRYDEALVLISRALELRPNDFYILDSMGWVKYKLGEHDQAIKYLRRALDVKMDAEIAAHLGEVLWVSGDKAGAKAVWREALELGALRETDVITEVMRRLDQ